MARLDLEVYCMTHYLSIFLFINCCWLDFVWVLLWLCTNSFLIGLHSVLSYRLSDSTNQVPPLKRYYRTQKRFTQVSDMGKFQMPPMYGWLMFKSEEVKTCVYLAAVMCRGKISVMVHSGYIYHTVSRICFQRVFEIDVQLILA